MMIAFHLTCIPPRVTHHAKRIVRVGQWTRLADKPELVAAKDSLDTLLLPHQPAAPVTGPVVLSLVFTWPWLKGDGKRVRALGRIPHDSKPDADNCAKGVTDALVRLRFLEQDSRVVELRVQKWRGNDAGIDVAITPWADMPITGTLRPVGVTLDASGQSGIPGKANAV
jgi:Holliday junction resolvase RusA-like endonuclease